MVSARFIASVCTTVLAVAACGDDGGVTAGGSGGGGASGGGAAPQGGGGEGGGGGAACVVEPSDDPLVVATDRGNVRGAELEGGSAWKGIPFAAPPVGALRWRAPAPAECYAGTFSATSFGSPCVQQGGSGANLGSEDCLTLNVWRPDAPAGSALPVLFFLYAGDNVSGSTADTWFGMQIYDALELAKGAGAVVVTANYRVGALGFLPHPAFAEENEYGATGNYGLMDQIAALEWVQRNIAAFSGDPQRVLLFGLSAGAVDACALLSSPLAAGDMSATMMMSGNCEAVMADALVASTSQTATDLMGCDGASDVAQCLRAKSPEEIASLPFDSATSDFNPVVDGYVLPVAPLDAFVAGAYEPMPVVIGTASDEYSILVDALLTAPVETQQDYEAFLDELVGPDGAPLVLEQYPLADYPSPRAAVVAIFSDLVFECPARHTARALIGAQDEAVLRYHFTHSFEDARFAQYGASHGFDMLFLFDKLDAMQPSSAEVDLSKAFTGYVSRFAATGNPNDASAPPWPVYELATDPYLDIDVGLTSGEGVRTAQCDFWDAAL